MFVVRQDGLKECGVACMLSVIRYYGGNVSLERLKEMTNTTKDGTNFYDMSNAFLQLGLISKGYKYDNIDKIINIDKPFISQVKINNYMHFVVVYKFSNNMVHIMDPAVGKRKISIEIFNKMWTGNILVIYPYKQVPYYNEDNFVLRTIKNILFDNKKIIYNLLFLSSIVTLFTCLYSYYFKIIIDVVYKYTKLNLLLVSLIFLVILVFKYGFSYLRNNLLLRLNEKIDLSIMVNTINRIILLPYNYYKNKTTGEMISRINDLFYIKDVISKIIVTVFLDFILVIVSYIILFIINKELSLYLLIIVLLYLLLFLLFRPYIKNMVGIVQDDNAKLNSVLVESISGYESVKGLNIQKKIINRINNLYLRCIGNNICFSKLININEFLFDMFEGIIILFIIYFGAIRVADGIMSIGELVIFNTLLYYFISPIRNFLEFYRDLFYVKTSIQRINNILNCKYEELDTVCDLNMNGYIVFKNLNFSYGSNKKILKDVNFMIEDKDRVLLLGPSGMGKSTLLKILFGYYNVGRGMVYLNGYDLCDFNLGNIRNNMTYISQNEILFNDTIRNNIILDRDISESDFIDVCKLVYVDEIIENNVGTYDFMIEENGANISGGQRQRIILARALLRDSKIILIDEGLNEIDINLERKILKNIFSKYLDKTFIIVSHRKDNLDLYSRIVKMKDGSIEDVMFKKSVIN